jgi:dTDP-glucose 4,6-dehydratase
MNPGSAISRTDFDHVLNHTSELWQDLRGARLFITGGSGFIGKWLIETLLAADERHRLGLRVTVLTRNGAALRDKLPWVAAAPAVAVLQGDVRSFAFPDGAFSHVIHAAGDLAVNAKPLYVHDVIVAGTRRVLEFVAGRGVADMMLVSSGAAYGRQPDDVDRLDEDFAGAPSLAEPRTAYGQGKREAEWLSHAYAAAHGFRLRIVRPFTLVGPYLPLDGDFAVASFVSDLLAGRPIGVTGDGTALRTYLYAADMAIWLWTALLRGPPGLVCNVGGEEVVSMAELATLIAGFARPPLPVRIAHTAPTARAAQRYVPSIGRARQVLGLAPTVLLEEGLRRMITSYGLAAAGRRILA